MSRFVKFLSRKELFDPLIKAPIYQDLLDAYLKWLRDYHHLCAGSVNLRRCYICRFLDWLGPGAAVKELRGLNAKQIEQFFISYSQNKGQSARRSMQAALRTFLRFCEYAGHTRRQLDQAVPTLRTYKLSTVPRGLNETQARKVLQTVDRKNPVGMRDYAILQLLYAYGVRSGQVRALRLGDINWPENQILFRALKNGKDSLLPLTADVGQGLLDYLGKARPVCLHQRVFLTSRAPYRPIKNAGAVSEIVRRYINAAGIDLVSKGSHAFRHAFVSRMLRQGHSLKAVADVLGHRCLSTTFIYTKIDFSALSQVGLDWPEEAPT